LNRLRIRRLTRTGNVDARLLHGYLENPEHFLWTILVGNTVSSFAAFGLIMVLFHRGLSEWPWLLVLVLLAMVLLLYAFCDLLPKMLFRRFPNRLCLFFAKPFRFVNVALSPLVGALEWLMTRLLAWTGTKDVAGIRFRSREELRSVLQESAHGVSADERAMIHRVLDLHNLTLKQIVKPMASVVAVNTATPVSEVIALCAEKGLTRLPVWLDKAQTPQIAGVITLKKLLYDTGLKTSAPVKEYLMPPLLLEEDVRIEVALKRMRQGGHRLAVVMDARQRPLGIVTLQDVLAVMFGELSL
ncbi:MAG TPA: CNNM domain-containing protein, partial [Roseimicrobium sp.]|nr:CNNM domain-containing protein [Roseimicrobium sp.]